MVDLGGVVTTVVLVLVLEKIGVLDTAIVLEETRAVQIAKKKRDLIDAMKFRLLFMRQEYIRM